jgi:branched-chain amino acid transport system ATP-binding protein
VAILEVNRLTKIFGGLTAVNDCSFIVEENAVVSLIGPNGAGKTTVFNIISGLFQPTSGSVIFNGTPLNGLEPHEIAKLGIGRAFQNTQLFNEVTVLDNLRIGRHCLTSAGVFGSLFRSRYQRSEENAIRRKAEECLDFMGMGRHADTLSMNLSYGDQKRVEIARALMMEPRLLLLDEPNSGMNTQETAELIELVRKINQQLGVTIVVISHHMTFVQTISSNVIVLNFGSIITGGKPHEVVADERVIEAYLGRVNKECLS